MTRAPRRFLVYCLTAMVPAAGLLAATTLSASAQTTAAAAHPSASAQAAALAKTAIEKISVGHQPQGKKVTSKPGSIKGLTQVQSTNWAGYADTGSSFSKVSSSWTEPSATCTSGAEQLAAFWVGIDGYSSDSVEQDGTIIECYQGRAYQYSWWEMYPTNAIQVVGSSVADSISSVVTRSGTTYTLTVTDSTHTANSFTKTETCSNCANSSAEWIAEAPSSGSSIYPLAHFSTWTASSDSVTEGSTSGTISSFTDDELTMIDSSKNVKAQPGSLNGSFFQVHEGKVLLSR
jgi:hypothetical protein